MTCQHRKMSQLTTQYQDYHQKTNTFQQQVHYTPQSLLQLVIATWDMESFTKNTKTYINKQKNNIHFNCDNVFKKKRTRDKNRKVTPQYKRARRYKFQEKLKDQILLDRFKTKKW